MPHPRRLPIRRLGTALAAAAAALACGTRGPKLTLRYHPPAGAAYHYTLEQHNTMKFENGPMAQMPPQEFTTRMFFSQSVTGPTDGGVGVTVHFDSTTTEPRTAPGGLGPTDPTRGMTANLVYDDRMNVVHAEFVNAGSAASPLTEQLGTGLKHMAFPLPTQAVGVGDSWTTETELPVGQVAGGGAPLTAQTKLTVKQIDTGGPDTTVLLGMETTFPGAPIHVVQQGQDVILKLSGNLTGEQLFSVTKGAAVRSSMGGTMHMNVSGGMAAMAGPDGMNMSVQQATTLQLRGAP